jgi:uncharacterized membrane protein
MFWQETAQNIAEKGAFYSTEQTIVAAAQWLKLGVEAVGALIIGYGVILAIYQFAAHFRDKEPSNFNKVRLTLGKYLTLALEFQVGADILSTAIAPGWEQIGKLAAIVVIRTVLNYFLTREVENEQKREETAAA